MADTGIFCTSAEVLQKAGAKASATSKAEAYTNSFVAQAESFINILCHTNYSDTYTTLNIDKKAILKEAASNLAAIYVINYDFSGFTTRTEAEDMINILWARFQQCIEILSASTNVTFLNNA